MKTNILIAMILAQASLSLAAKTVTSTPGNLALLLGDDPDVASLTIDGQINAADLRFIADSLDNLTTLDLSQVKIEPYSGTKLLGNLHEAPADVLPPYSLAGLKATSIKLPASLTAIGDGALAASAIRSIEIPEGVTLIATASFNGCTDLSSVTLPQNITTISPLSFKGCSSLSSINIPASVTTIGAEAFSNCSNLREVETTDGLAEIDSCAFAHCNSLATFNFPSTLTRIGDEAFQATGLNSVDLSMLDNLREIGAYAFAHCPELTEAILPDELANTGEGLFYECNDLTSVILPSSITTLAPFILKGTALESDEGVMQPAIREIGGYALYGTGNLISLTLPATLDSIGDRAMNGMTSLEKIDASTVKKIPSLGNNVFAGTASSDVILLASEDNAPIFKATPQWQEFDIQISNGGIGTSVDAIADSRLNIKYDGETLYLEAQKPIVTVELYDTGARLINRVEFSPATTTASIKARMDGNVAILRVTFNSDNSSSSTSLKIKL